MAHLSCRSCGSPLDEVFLDLGASPLSNRFLRAEELSDMEPTYPLCARVCTGCWLVQLPVLVEPDQIFTDYPYFSSVSESWQRHCEAYAEAMVHRLALSSGSQVIEIASNDGCMLQGFQRRGIPVLGVEPAANVAAAAESKGIPTLVRFFGTATARKMVEEGQRADLLFGTNVLAHVPDLNDFIAGMAMVLKPEGIFTMEFPHLMRLVEGNQFDTIYHEHFSYFSFLAVEAAFKRHGFEIYDIEELPVHGGSLRIFGHLRGDPSGLVASAVAGLRQRERSAGYDGMSIYSRFASQVEETKRDLLSFLIEAKRAGKRIVGYGAPAKGNTLLNYCGIRRDFLDFTVDRSEHKQGKYLPGSRIPVHSPERLRETRPDYVLILPWNMKDEIVQQMACVRDWGGRFVVPVPRVEVLP